MRAPLALALAVLVAACAPRPYAAKTKVSDGYAERRPVVVSVRIDGPTVLVVPLRDALFRELIDRNYSPLAPGAPAGTETGILRVEVKDTEDRRDVTARLEDSSGAVLYTAVAKDFSGSPETMALVLLWDLPSK